jgi:methionyl-tRNA formyltransferase
MITVTIFGNQQIAIDILSYLLEKKSISVRAVIGCETQQDIAFGYPSLKKYCKENNIQYFNAKDVFNNFSEYLSKIKADYYLSIYFRRIFTRQHLAKLGEVINIHPSLLPSYRGPSPTLWALLNNEKYIGITMHYIDSNVDTGDIIAQRRIVIPEDVSGYQLNALAMQQGVRLFKAIFPKMIRGSHRRIKQSAMKASYYGRFQSSMRKISWFQSGRAILNKIRALTAPYNGALTSFKGRPVILWSATISDKKYPNIGPGKVMYADKKFLLVTAVDAILKITSYEFENSDEALVIKKGDTFDTSV